MFLSDIYLLSVNHPQQYYQWRQISPDFVVDVPTLGGRFALSNVYNNAVVSGEDPYLTTNEAVSQLLGVRTSGYLFMQDRGTAELSSRLWQSWDDGQSIAAYLLTYLQSMSPLHWAVYMWNYPQVGEQIVSTYSRYDFLWISHWINTYERDQANVIGDQYGIPSQYSFGEGLEPDILLIDQTISPMLTNKSILAEQIKLEIFNAAAASGLAGRVSRVLGNYGINVVRFANAPRPEDNTVLYVREGVNAEQNVATIVSLLGREVVVELGEYEYNSTGDIVLVLGADLKDF